MTDALDLASMVEAARKAAAAGDFSTAARLMRDVSVIQEATHGSLHPELAKTLNVLGLVCERANNVAEAEQCYRRSHAIAVASLGPRDPFVANSIKNLVDFCARHDIPIWKPREAPSDDDSDRITDVDTDRITDDVSDRIGHDLEADEEEVTLPAIVQAVEANAAADIEANALADFEADAEAIAPADADAEVDAALLSPRETVPVISQSAHRTIVPLAFGIAAIVAVGFMVKSRETVSTTTSTPTPSTTTSAPATETKPTAPVEATPGTKAARVERPAARATSVTSTSVTPPPVTVLKAQLCSALDRRGSPDWRCTPASVDLHPGTFIFYTRLLTTTSTTVQHRWYFNGEVHQVMRLRVAPNPRGGYRTFSSNRIIRDRAGDWRVELRAADGALLQEERFVVR